MGSCRGNCNGSRCKRCGKYLCGYRDCDVGYSSGSWVKVGDDTEWLCWQCGENIDKIEEIRKLLLEHMDAGAADTIMRKIDGLCG